MQCWLNAFQNFGISLAPKIRSRAVVGLRSILLQGLFAKISCRTAQLKTALHVASTLLASMGACDSCPSRARTSPLEMLAGASCPHFGSTHLSSACCVCRQLLLRLLA